MKEHMYITKQVYTSRLGKSHTRYKLSTPTFTTWTTSFDEARLRASRELQQGLIESFEYRQFEEIRLPKELK